MFRFWKHASIIFEGCVLCASNAVVNRFCVHSSGMMASYVMKNSKACFRVKLLSFIGCASVSLCQVSDV